MIRAALALLFFLACVACVTPKADPRIEQMQAELEAMKAEKAKPPAPAPAQITSQVVSISGVKLPKGCGIMERSDINVKAPVWAALLICQTKPEGVAAVPLPKKPEPKK